MVKLLVATSVLAILVFLIMTDINGALQAVLIICTIVLALPITLLIGIDASRVIRQQTPAHKPLRVLGNLLAFPQAIFGTILIGFAIIYPLFGVRELIDDLANGVTPLEPLVRLFIAALGFVVGVHYIREGLGIRKKAR